MRHAFTYSSRSRIFAGEDAKDFLEKRFPRTQRTLFTRDGIVCERSNPAFLARKTFTVSHKDTISTTVPRNHHPKQAATMVFKKFKMRIKQKIQDAIEDALEEVIGRIDNQEDAQAAFEDNKPDSMRYKDIRMISGCEDAQTSADVSNVGSFQLPDPAGRAGGACTSTLLRILYKDEHVPEDTLSFTEVLEKMRKDLGRGGYSQVPQLTSLNKIDVHTDFDLVPPEATGVRRAVMIGINYVGQDGELRGCHNDVLNMVSVGVIL